MTTEKLHLLEEEYEAILAEIEELQLRYPDVDLEATKARLYRLGAALTSIALGLDKPDKPLI